MKKASQFMFTAETGDLLRCEIDPRVGGEFVMADRRSGGDVEHLGQHLEIERPYRLVFTFGIPSESPGHDIVTIEIKPVESGCELTLSTEMKPEWAELAERSRDAWARILSSLDGALSSPNNAA